MSTNPLLTQSAITLYNSNNTVLNVGPIVDGGQYSLNPPVIKYVIDLTLTAYLYSGRNIANPTVTPGSLVTAFNTTGSIVLPYTSLGLYVVTVPAFTVPTGQYQLVFDAPLSPSGYQVHYEQNVSIQTGGV